MCARIYEKCCLEDFSNKYFRKDETVLKLKRANNRSNITKQNEY